MRHFHLAGLLQPVLDFVAKHNHTDGLYARVVAGTDIAVTGDAKHVHIRRNQCPSIRVMHSSMQAISQGIHDDCASEGTWISRL